MMLIEVSLTFNLMLNQRTTSREAVVSISKLQSLALRNQESNHGCIVSAADALSVTLLIFI